MDINIFEPSLQVRHPLLDYEKLEIQGTFPRPHEIPTDVFPTYSVIAGVHNDRPVGKVATFTEDNRLRVDSAGGGNGVTPRRWVVDSLDYGISGESSVRTQQFFEHVNVIYAILCVWDVQGLDTIGPIAGPVSFSLEGLNNGNIQMYYEAGIGVFGNTPNWAMRESKYIAFNPPLDPYLMGWQDGDDMINMYIANDSLQALDTSMHVYHD